jgi:ubiquinone/menaquinone biosynthesis C-methylase UbiE
MSQDATDRIRDNWDRQAAGWYEYRERFFDATRPVHEWLVDHLDLREGMNLLDVAAGPGDTGLLAARRLGRGRVLSTDIAPAMVDAARKRGRELGIANVDYRVLDAQAMDLADGTFDRIVCRWGFMLMPDPSAALRECRRVLAPGGRLTFAVFTGPDENPFASIPARIMIQRGHVAAPGPGWQPGILALGDRARLQSLVEGAGFTSIDIDSVNMRWTFADADDYWRFLTDLTALGPAVRALPDAARDEIRAAVNERLVPFTADDSVALPSQCWVGVALR